MSKSNSILDHIEGRGTVCKRLIDNRTGEVVKELTDHNLIVKAGRSTLIQMIAGEQTTSVTHMAVGRGGTANLREEAFNPVEPTPNDQGLNEKVTMKQLLSKDTNLTGTNPKVTFVGVFDCTEVNSLINECGLFFKGETVMFARHTFDTVSLKRESNFSLQISWTIEF